MLFRSRHLLEGQTNIIDQHDRNTKVFCHLLSSERFSRARTAANRQNFPSKWGRCHWLIHVLDLPDSSSSDQRSINAVAEGAFCDAASVRLPKCSTAVKAKTSAPPPPRPTSCAALTRCALESVARTGGDAVAALRQTADKEGIR